MYAAPDGNVLMVKSANMTDYPPQTVTVCTFPPGCRPATALTGFTVHYTPQGTAASEDHLVDVDRSAARWETRRGGTDSPVRVDRPLGGACGLSVGGILTVTITGSTPYQALGLYFNPNVPLFKAA